MKEKMAWALTALVLLAIFRDFSPALILRFFGLFAFLFIFEFIFWKVRGVIPFRPTAGAVSALIIFLLADPTSPLYLSIFALFFAIFLKQFLRPLARHIFNPAASGLFLASLFGLPISWWGIASDSLTLFLTILLTGYVSLYVVRQWNIALSFIAATIFLSALVTSSVQTALSQLLVGSFWFFTLVMLPEPMTAAHYPKTKIIYGSLVALLSFLIALTGVTAEPLVTSLLLGNAAARAVEVKYSG